MRASARPIARFAAGLGQQLYALEGLKAGYAAPENKYELAVFVRNLTNEKNLKGVLDNYNAAVFNDPRIIGVSLSGKF